MATKVEKALDAVLADVRAGREFPDAASDAAVRFSLTHAREKCLNLSGVSDTLPAKLDEMIAALEARIEKGE